MTVSTKSGCNFDVVLFYRQLPNETRLFIQVDRSWTDIMRRAADRPNAIKAATAPGKVNTRSYYIHGCNIVLAIVAYTIMIFIKVYDVISSSRNVVRCNILNVLLYMLFYHQECWKYYRLATHKWRKFTDVSRYNLLFQKSLEFLKLAQQTQSNYSSIFFTV